MRIKSSEFIISYSYAGRIKKNDCWLHGQSSLRWIQSWTAPTLRLRCARCMDVMFQILCSSGPIPVQGVLSSVLKIHSFGINSELNRLEEQIFSSWRRTQKLFLTIRTGMSWGYPLREISFLLLVTHTRKKRNSRFIYKNQTFIQSYFFLQLKKHHPHQRG